MLARMFTILYQDEHLVAIDKPSGALVHRTATSREGHIVLQGLRDQLGRWVWPVHRLDRATSGVLLLALDPETASALARQFKERSVDKRYLALVRGWPEASGVIDRPVHTGEHRNPEEKKPAVTEYRRLAQVELPVEVDRYPTSRYALVEAHPVTGRYQQIRQHLKKISHPIIGDTTWGNGKHNRFFRERYGIRRLMLHAVRLAFTHPASGDPLAVEAPVDGQWRGLFREFGWEEPEL
ncbi:MAG TPA: pseudouridylate synthase [Thiolapillus brandeum]|uniref:tRNA pseudouridine synthase C n=1 Tax=Thiolapillus brandeum TaxID=1076588 RepID=A0A7C5N7F8_9GAMM|nr:pseudouridylate synthase [Thiolapillus brandeum]